MTFNPGLPSVGHFVERPLWTLPSKVDEKMKRDLIVTVLIKTLQKLLQSEKLYKPHFVQEVKIIINSVAERL